MSYEQQIRQILNENAESEAHAIRVHDAIAKLLAGKYAGKRITKRIVADLRAALGYSDAAVISYSLPYSLASSYQIMIWGKETPWPTYNDAPSFSLGSMTGDVEAFERIDICHGSAARKRNAERALMLSAKGAVRLEALARDLRAYSEARDQLKGWFEYGSPFDADTYAIRKLVNWGAP